MGEKIGRKRILVGLLILSMFAAIWPDNIVLADVAVVGSGKIGNNSWKLDSNGVLTLSGTDRFVSVAKGSVPWYSKRSEIKQVSFDMSRVPGGDISNYFADCPKLKVVNNIPVGVQNMQESFMGCPLLEKIGTIPDTVTSTVRTFKNCNALNQRVVVPKSVVTASGMFDGCKKLTYTPLVQSDQIMDMSYMFRYTAIVTPPHLSKKAVNLSYAFSNCEKLQSSPDIPETVAEMNYTFQNCYSLTKVPAIPMNVVSMRYTFTYCMEMVDTPIIVSQKVEDMMGAFSYCYEMLKAPKIPDSVTNLNYAFYNCMELREAPDIPAGVTTMRYCLAGCSYAEGEITVYTRITDPERYHCFAGDTALGTPMNKPYYLGGQGKGIKVNYVKSNQDYVLKYMAQGWNSGSLLNYKSIGALSLGSQKQQSVESCTVKGLKSGTYTGSEVRPAPEIWYSSVQLKRNTDYTFSYQNNINAGTAVLIITGKGDYKGEKRVEYQIKQAVFQTVKSYSYSGYYDGKPHSIEVTQEENGTVEYGVQEGQYTMKTCPEYTMPGTYKTYFRVVKPNYVTYTGSANVVIMKKTLQVDTFGYSGEYDGNPHSIQIQTEADTQIEYGVKPGEYSTQICPSYVNVGNYPIYFRITKTGYETYTGMQSVVIRRKQINTMAFPSATKINYGDVLGRSALSFSYNAYGTFAWKDPEIIPDGGMRLLPVVFQPEDLVNYDYSLLEGYDEKEKTVVRNVSVCVVTPTPTPTKTPSPTSVPTEMPNPGITPASTPGEDPSKPVLTPSSELKPQQSASPEPGSIQESPAQSESPLPGVESDMTEKPVQGEETQGGQPVQGNSLTDIPVLKEPDWVESSEQPMTSDSDEPGISQLIKVFDNWQEKKYVVIEKKYIPSIVKIRNVVRKKKKIYLRWKKVKGAKGYQVMYSSGKKIKKGVKRKNVRSTQTSFKWKKNKKCYVKIRAYTIKKRKKIYGKWSKIYCVSRGK